jgi:prevent-host-death family protein
MAKKPESYASIGQVKRDISELVNRVAYGGERVVLTSRGKPKAALVSIDDYELLQREKRSSRLEVWEQWVARVNALGDQILARRGGKPLDVDRIWESAREERDSRLDWLFDQQ